MPRQGSQPVRPVDPSGGRLGRTGRAVLNEDFSPLTTTPQPTTGPSKMLKEKLRPAAPQDGPALRSLIAKSLAMNRPIVSGFSSKIGKSSQCGCGVDSKATHETAGRQARANEPASTLANLTRANTLPGPAPAVSRSTRANVRPRNAIRAVRP